MGSQTQTNLNWLHRHLPDGLVVDARWLEHHDFSRQLRLKYVQNGWLRKLSRTVYTRPSLRNTKIPWQHLVISLQALMDLPIAIGGRTALESQGFGHYLTMRGRREIHLYTNQNPPGWVRHLPGQPKLVFHRASKLFLHGEIPPYRDGKSVARQRHPSLAPLPWGTWDWPLVVSTPERAILELLAEVPERETFQQADALMEGLRTLSPRRLQPLLANCRSVKVKRLFLWLAERHNHPWLRRLDPSSIDLGKGKRMLVRGGKLDAKYNITVPKKLHGGF
jgi:Transcriptional regulator, AbiEi antitoxin, Type IV TA system/Transcriptional regulator, AbiEi antitoxin N-terminal domain